MASKHPLKVFISYASADREQAGKLHAFLKQQGAAPWLDVEDLLPGQDWKMEIAKALEDTDLVLLCLSKHSISREGYVQKEMRLALDRALEIPPGEIFLIPVRFEDVPLPYSLRDYQYVDLFVESGMKRLIQSLNLRAERVKAAPLSIDNPPPDLKTAKKEKAAPRKKSNPPAATEIHIHGDVTGSNIIIGDDNQVTNKKSEN